MSQPALLEDLLQLMHSLKRSLFEQVENLNFSITPMHIRVIKIISKTSPCTIMNVVNMLERDKAQVTRLINGLIDEGFIKKEPNLNDKRSQYLSMAEKGEEVMKKVKEIDDRLMSSLVQNIDEIEIQAFQKTAKKLVENLKK